MMTPEQATEKAEELYLSDDVDILAGTAEPTDGGWWVQALVWVPDERED